MVVLSLVCVLGLSSCHKEESAITPRPVTNEESLQKINQHLNNFSLALAQIMESAEVRTLLKTEALKRFDGDYDILYKNVSNIVLSDGSTLKTRLERLDPSTSAEDNFGKLPTLQISVPINIEKWDTQAFVPYVAVNEWGFQEKDVQVHKSYDSKGAIHLLNAQQAPDFPVVVVGLGERVDAKGNLKGRYSNANARHFFKIPIGYVCRNDKDVESILGINCPDLGQFESWANGSPEFRLIIKSSMQAFSGETYSGPFWAPSRSSVYDGNWWNPNVSMIQWDKDVFGTTLLYYWYEEDGGAQSQEITASFSYKDDKTGLTSSVSTTIKIGSLDDDIGKKVILQTDCPFSNGLIHQIGSNFNFKSLGSSAHALY